MDFQFTGWFYVLASYISLAAISLIPVIYRFFKRVELHPGGSSIEDSLIFSDELKTKLKQHISRIEGTLGFWKHQTAKYKTFHNYSIVWITLASVLIPVLSQTINAEDPYSKWLITVMSTHVAILLAFNKAIKTEENYKAFRHGESEYYDLYRRLLDRPTAFGESEEEQLYNYFEQVEAIRRYVRNAETDNLATLEDAKALSAHTGKKQ